jgi:hypothetical protein
MLPVVDLRATLGKLVGDAVQLVGDDGSAVSVVVAGGRRQEVRASRVGSSYIFSSTAVPRRHLQGLNSEQVAALIWQRNQAGEVVAYALDARGRLVGRAELPCSMLTAANAGFLVERVASECDRLEYLFTGGDHE